MTHTQRSVLISFALHRQIHTLFSTRCCQPKTAVLAFRRLHVLSLPGLHYSAGPTPTAVPPSNVFSAISRFAFKNIPST